MDIWHPSAINHSHKPLAISHDARHHRRILGSTVGGVKAAFNRGRSKLAPRPESPAPSSVDLSQLLQMYVERFNRRDWDGLRELISADARLEVADRFSGRLTESPYFRRYDQLAIEWRMALGVVDGDPAIVMLHRDASGWTPRSVSRLNIVDQHVIGVSDYKHCPWIIPAASSFDVSLAGGEP